MVNYVKKIDLNVLCKNDLEDCWLCLNDVITNMIKKFIIKITNASNHIRPKWLTKEVIKTVKLKHRRFCEHKRHSSYATLIRYVEVRNKRKSIVEQAKEKFERSIALACKIIRLCSGSTPKDY